MKVVADSKDEAVKMAMTEFRDEVVFDRAHRICSTCDAWVDDEGRADESCSYGDDFCDECGRCHCNQAC